MLKEGKSISEICRHYNLSRDTFEKFRDKYPSVDTILRVKNKSYTLTNKSTNKSKN